MEQEFEKKKPMTLSFTDTEKDNLKRIARENGFKNPSAFLVKKHKLDKK